MKTLMVAISALTIVGASSVSALAQSDQPSPQGHGALRAACQTDLDKFCADIQGHGRFQCLREHQDQVSDGCKAALSQAHSWHHDQSGATPDTAQHAPNNGE